MTSNLDNGTCQQRISVIGDAHVLRFDPRDVPFTKIVGRNYSKLTQLQAEWCQLEVGELYVKYTPTLIQDLILTQ